MTEISNRNQILERLARVVEAYGADEARWPEKDRTQLAALIATHIADRQVRICPVNIRFDPIEMQINQRLCFVS